MTKIVFSRRTFLTECESCRNPIFLPGIVPSVQMLKELGWKYCPFCGEEIEYEEKEEKGHDKL